MDYVNEIREFIPCNDQELQDKRVILNYINQCKGDVLNRENEIAHLTSSGFIMNNTLDKVLMVHHNIRNTWAWTGGHVDGDSNLLYVAIKEAREETGVSRLNPLFEKIASVDILPVFGHERKGEYVNAHLHLSIAYILICNESETLKMKPDENSGVKWFLTDQVTETYFDTFDVYLYHKLINKANVFFFA